jgi:hypothetical protein
LVAMQSLARRAVLCMLLVLLQDVAVGGIRPSVHARLSLGTGVARPLLNGNSREDPSKPISLEGKGKACTIQLGRICLRGGAGVESIQAEDDKMDRARQELQREENQEEEEEDKDPGAREEGAGGGGNVETNVKVSQAGKTRMSQRNLPTSCLPLSVDPIHSPVSSTTRRILPRHSPPSPPRTHKTDGTFMWMTITKTKTIKSPQKRHLAPLPPRAPH